MRVLLSVGEVGVRATLLTTGAVFWMVTVSKSVAPLTVPSLGVTVQRTVSPFVKPLDTVLLVPMVLPPLDQTYE